MSDWDGDPKTLNAWIASPPPDDTDQFLETLHRRVNKDATDAPLVRKRKDDALVTTEVNSDDYTRSDYFDAMPIEAEDFKAQSYRQRSLQILG